MNQENFLYASNMLPKALQNLIDELKKLPGIGARTAERLAFFLTRQHRSQIQNLGNAFFRLSSSIHFCKNCFNVSEENLCGICAGKKFRDTSVMCVVEEPTDVFAIEKTHEFRGLYHVLHGKISPLNKIMPKNLKIAELVSRVKQKLANGEKIEVILATNPDIEGETTAMYIAKILKPLNIKITRIARGIPVGSDIEYADQITLKRALEGRQEFSM